MSSVIENKENINVSILKQRFNTHCPLGNQDLEYRVKIGVFVGETYPELIEFSDKIKNLGKTNLTVEAAAKAVSDLVNQYYVDNFGYIIEIETDGGKHAPVRSYITEGKCHLINDFFFDRWKD